MKEKKRLKDNRKNKRFSDHNEKDSFRNSRTKKDFKRKKMSIEDEETWVDCSNYEELIEDE